MTEPENAARVEDLTATDFDYLREHRSVAVIEIHRDGSATTRVWLVDTDMAERVGTLLGEPETTSFAPPGSVNTLADIAEGLPSS